MRSLISTILLASATAWSAPAENLLGKSSFEDPKAKGRTPETDEGLINGDEDDNPWLFFGVMPGPEGGKIDIGLTDEVARTGKQSIYIDFQKVTAAPRQAVLMTKLIAVKPAQAYRLSMWGRIDRKRPLSLDERRPYMVLDVEFFAGDQETKVGDPLHGVQLIPGSVVPGGPHPLIYTSKKWAESSAQFVTPANTAFLRVTWRWATPTDIGETDGTIFWDDASLVEDASPAPAQGAGKGPKPAEQPTGKDSPVPKPDEKK